MADPVFAFGENWARFLTSLSDRQIEQATHSLRALVGRDLQDKTFLDIGSGSGLSSLAARRLGAMIQRREVPVDVEAAKAVKHHGLVADRDDCTS